jgi:hypothetical protein
VQMTSESLIIPTDWRDNPSHARILTIAHRDFAFCAACQELIPVDMSKKQKRKHEHFKNGYNTNDRSSQIKEKSSRESIG